MNGWEFANNNPWISIIALAFICWAFTASIGGLRKPADNALVNFLRLLVMVTPFVLKLINKPEPAKKVDGGKS